MYSGAWWNVVLWDGGTNRKVGSYLEFAMPEKPSYIDLTALKGIEDLSSDLKIFLRCSIRQICDLMRAKNAVSFRISWSGLKGRARKKENRLIIIKMKRAVQNEEGRSK